MFILWIFIIFAVLKEAIREGFLMQRKAFTLMELLVVMSIISMLMMITMPSLHKAREKGRQVVCASNLHSIGQGIYIYATNYKDALIPGDHVLPWAVWADFGRPGTVPRAVNLGHLMTSDSLPVPGDKKNSIFFCPSMGPTTVRTDTGESYFDYDSFKRNWSMDPTSPYGAPVNYMFNTSLDGSSRIVHSGAWQIMAHTNKIQYLLGEGSVHTFNALPVIYDCSVGPELIQEVNARYGVNFPAMLLHKWLVNKEIDVSEANAFLSDPGGWMLANAKLKTSSNPVSLAAVAKASLACDVVGVFWGPPPQPPCGCEPE